MAQQDKDQVTVTFNYVAACFSEEEWKLIQEWQKELYRSAMKDIHQALISLGYTIINPDTLVRINNKQETYIWDLQEQDRITNINESNSSCSLAAHPDILLRIQQTEEPCCRDWSYVEELEMSNSSNKEQEVITPVVPSSITEEGEAYFMDHTYSEGKESITICAGGNTSVYSTEQQRASYWEGTPMIIECGRSVGQKIDVIDGHEIEPREALNTFTQSGRSLSQCSNPVKQKRAQRGQRPCTLTECGTSFRESPTLSPHQEVHTGSELYICSKCQNCFSKSANETSHHQVNKGEEHNICNKCKKRSRQSRNPNRDKKKDMGEKPHTCIACGKSFGNSQALKVHHRVHTGEKPYTCSQCEKSFRQIQHLVKHRRMHTGEKPYICNVCERRFINSSNLRRHQQLHTRELEIVTWTIDG